MKLVKIIAPQPPNAVLESCEYKKPLNKNSSANGAITLTSFIWTIIHFQYELLILVVLFIFGLFLGYIRFAYNSLGLPIALHAVNNLFAFFMAYYFF